MPPRPIQLAVGLKLTRVWRSDSLSRQAFAEECLAEAAAARADGFSGVEIPSPFAERLRGVADTAYWSDLGRRLRDLGVEPSSVHGPNLPPLEVDQQKAIDLVRWHAELTQAIGARAIVVHPTSHSHPHVCDVVPRLLERDRAVCLAAADELRGSGARLAVENLPTYGIAYLERLIAGIDHEHVGVCFDTGHWNVRPERWLAEVLASLGPRIVHLHLSDNHGLCDEHNPPGVGTFPWQAFFDALPAGAISPHLLVELSLPEPDDEAAKSRRRAASLTRRVLAGCGFDVALTESRDPAPAAGGKGDR